MPLVFHVICQTISHLKLLLVFDITFENVFGPQYHMLLVLDIGEDVIGTLYHTLRRYWHSILYSKMLLALNTIFALSPLGRNTVLQIVTVGNPATCVHPMQCSLVVQILYA
jgi:hypothetical protein